MSSQKKILIIDDDEDLGESLVDILSKKGYMVEWVGNGADAFTIIKNDSVDIVLLDLLLPGIDGIQILKKILNINPAIPVIMISGHGNIQTAWEASQSGAYSWLEKPFSKEQLFLTIRNAIEKNTLLKERDFFLSEVKERYKMVGTSPAMKQIYQLIDKVAGRNITTLITGESGTGKELVANAIHFNSYRASAPFIRVNCAAIPETLIESELFGQRKGAFTNAIRDKRGKFQMADGGTLFLDEIGDLSLSAQAKVLRALDTGEVMAVGSESANHVDVRFITATNKNLKGLIADGLFREDLFHRINVIEIHIPTLKERKMDIIPITEHFMDLYSAENNIENKNLTKGAQTVLVSYEWPGNIRELKNFAEKVVALIDTKDVTSQQAANLLKFPLVAENLLTRKNLKQAKEDFEKIYIYQALHQSQWNITRAAESLNLHRTGLYKKMEKYGIKHVSTKSND